jgi:hypothetical protein
MCLIKIMKKRKIESPSAGRKWAREKSWQAPSSITSQHSIRMNNKKHGFIRRYKRACNRWKDLGDSSDAI